MNVLSSKLSGFDTHGYNPPNPALIKQVARIICHIRDDIYRQYPQTIMPTRRMIETLVYNTCNESLFTGKNWQAMVEDTLQNLQVLTDLGIDDICQFTQQDGVTPLFPNHELFDEWDAHRFSRTLLSHLSEELN